MVASSRVLASGTRHCMRASGRRVATTSARPTTTTSTAPRAAAAAAAAAPTSASAPPFADAAPVPMPAPPTPGEVRVRFAPSPTGNLHVGGARTALFNWLYAKKMGGKFILRIEDTDTARSTRESEEAMKSDLRWLGLDWDEGPDLENDPSKTAPHGPYRQSERAPLYQSLVSRLVAEGKAYPCFCTDAELEAMKAEAEAKKLAPIYRGKWANATKEEVEEELKKGTPCCYRFRVPAGREVAIDDAVRGRVAWSTDTLGDFVVLRSNGLPVYNFCVAVDDALMRVTDVLRAEEHLPNTLRQVLVYEALGFPIPRFAHMSLILAPDRSKLSKRHGATSVGEFRQQGFLPQAMVNYLALLGWNDGTEQEVFSAEELSAKFSVERITKSPAVFDRTKLSWMNGQHLRGLSESELERALVDALSGGEGSGGEAVLSGAGRCDAAFAAACAALVKGSVDVLTEAAPQVRAILDYPLERTASDEADKAFAAVRDDGFGEIVQAVLAAADSGELQGAAEAGDGGEGYKTWAKAVGKATGRKGKRLFMPLRVALTGRTQGPDVGEVVAALARCDPGRDLAAGVAFVPLSTRVAALRAWAGKEGLLQ